MKRIVFIALIAISLVGCHTNKKEININPVIAVNNKEVKYQLTTDDLLEEKDANDVSFDINNVEQSSSLLKDKTFYWLGSSVTYGHESEGNSMVEYVAALSGATCYKDAISGTTLLTDNSNVKSGEKSYTSRLTNSEIFDKNATIDGFICQISTNDCTPGNVSKKGIISEGYDSFDLKTTLGGVEYIISYVNKTWHCPIYFYSGAYFKDGKDMSKRENNNPPGSNYSALIKDVNDIAIKWIKNDVDVKLIDLYNDEQFNATASNSYYNWAMKDPIHPKKAGYLQWWSPYIISALEKSYNARLS